MKFKLAAAVIAIALCAAGYFAYRYLEGSNTRFEAACGSPGCGWTGPAVLRGTTSEFPPRCGKCNKNTVFPLSTCRACGHKQILNQYLKDYIPEKANLPDATKCEKCGGPIVHGD